MRLCLPGCWFVGRGGMTSNGASGFSREAGSSAGDGSPVSCVGVASVSAGGISFVSLAWGGGVSADSSGVSLGKVSGALAVRSENHQIPDSANTRTAAAPIEANMGPFARGGGSTGSGKALVPDIVGSMRPHSVRDVIVEISGAYRSSHPGKTALPSGTVPGGGTSGAMGALAAKDGSKSGMTVGGAGSISCPGKTALASGTVSGGKTSGATGALAAMDGSAS
ncbi:MAG: hypothetical protein LBP86_10920 [Azoarcus sp.]|nr:hypothetical protein [Azoarcus sp.]